ncbi:heavy metal sensor histidine kinase [Paucibacter sp. R3-3]|uniref:Sensor protein n=1 Tax=Roseateles agri TaxID=3098619 RepID=A0ABU5DCD4_9BURK|nr:heavy metal sensor histidine kinase [Paucibacter sp. R3-3]MDY0743946.1 heavy metal sensor histidine kinase [Paucibacter sp. R3-3]
MSPARRHGSISARLVFMLALVAVAVFSVTGLLLHKVLEQVLMDDEGADLRGKIDVVKHFIKETPDAGELPMLSRHLAATSIGGRFRWNVWLVGRDGQMLYGAEPMPPTVQHEGDKVLLRRQDGIALRGASFRLPDDAVFPDAQVFIGMDPRPRQNMLATYDAWGIVVGAAGVLCTIALAWLATRRGLRALSELSSEAEQIQPGTLSRRLTPPEHSAELMPLAERFNDVLARMEEAWHQLEGFNANVAHELRTPLAIMINGAEVALARDRPADEMRDVLESHLEELRGMASMINDMLFLARADQGDAAKDLAELSLREEALDVGEYVEVLLDEKQQRFSVEGEQRIPANRALLRRALVNLLTNASRHAPAGTTLTVRIEPWEDTAGARMSVLNPGEPIPEEVRRRMFDRFWRGEVSRAKSGDRFGLGLAIVRAVARMHGGETFVGTDGADGRTQIGFTLRPASSPSPTDRPLPTAKTG